MSGTCPIREVAGMESPVLVRADTRGHCARPATTIRVTISSARLGRFDKAMDIDANGPADMERDFIEGAAHTLHFEVLSWLAKPRIDAMEKCVAEISAHLAARKEKP